MATNTLRRRSDVEVSRRQHCAAPVPIRGDRGWPGRHQRRRQQLQLAEPAGFRSRPEPPESVMSREAVNLLVGRAVVDRAFCALLLTRPREAAQEFDLSEAERQLL